MNEKPYTIFTLKLQGLIVDSPDKLKYITQCFERIVNEKVFETKNGRVVLNFNNGTLMDIWREEKLWKRKKVDKD